MASGEADFHILIDDDTEAAPAGGPATPSGQPGAPTQATVVPNLQPVVADLGENISALAVAITGLGQQQGKIKPEKATPPMDRPRDGRTEAEHAGTIVGAVGNVIRAAGLTNMGSIVANLGTAVQQIGAVFRSKPERQPTSATDKTPTPTPAVPAPLSFGAMTLAVERANINVTSAVFADIGPRVTAAPIAAAATVAANARPTIVTPPAPPVEKANLPVPIQATPKVERANLPVPVQAAVPAMPETAQTGAPMTMMAFIIDRALIRVEQAVFTGGQGGPQGAQQRPQLALPKPAQAEGGGTGQAAAAAGGAAQTAAGVGEEAAAVGGAEVAAEGGAVAAAGGLAAVGAVALPVAASLGAVAAAGYGFARMVESFVDRGEELAAYSQTLSEASARAEIKSMQADIREANALEGPLTELTDAWMDLKVELRELLLPIKRFVVEILVPIVETIEEFIMFCRIEWAAYQAAFLQLVTMLENFIKGEFTVAALAGALTGPLMNAAREVIKELLRDKQEKDVRKIMDRQLDELMNQVGQIPNVVDPLAAAAEQSLNLPALAGVF
jgi:hypothetical protein